MKQYSFISESGNGILSKFGGTKSQRNKLTKYIKSKKWIKMAAPDHKYGNDILRNMGKDYIKHGYKEPPLDIQTYRDSINKLGF